MKISSMVEKHQTISSDDFQNWVDDYSDSVYKLCRSLTYSKEDADDLFQETFLRAIEQLKRNTLQNPQNYLFSTTVYIWKNWKRRYARRKRIAPVKPLDESMANGTDLESDFMKQEEARMVQDLIQEMPDPFKIPIILYYSTELSISDIALTLKIPAGTVKSRLYKARKLIEKGLVALHYEQ